jgi:hypothetical protein
MVNTDYNSDIRSIDPFTDTSKLCFDATEANTQFVVKAISDRRVWLLSRCLDPPTPVRSAIPILANIYYQVLSPSVEPTVLGNQGLFT